MIEPGFPEHVNRREGTSQRGADQALRIPGDPWTALAASPEPDKGLQHPSKLGKVHLALAADQHEGAVAADDFSGRRRPGLLLSSALPY